MKKKVFLLHPLFGTEHTKTYWHMQKWPEQAELNKMNCLHLARAVTINRVKGKTACEGNRLNILILIEALDISALFYFSTSFSWNT